MRWFEVETLFAYRIAIVLGTGVSSDYPGLPSYSQRPESEETMGWPPVPEDLWMSGLGQGQAPER